MPRRSLFCGGSRGGVVGWRLSVGRQLLAGRAFSALGGLAAVGGFLRTFAAGGSGALLAVRALAGALEIGAAGLLQGGGKVGIGEIGDHIKGAQGAGGYEFTGCCGSTVGLLGIVSNHRIVREQNFFCGFGGAAGLDTVAAVSCQAVTAVKQRLVGFFRRCG